MEVSFNSLPAGPSEARALGQRYYFTGKPCVRGHITKRVADYSKKAGGRCHACLLQDVQRSATKNAGRTLIRKVRSGAKARGIVFSVTRDYLEALLEPMRCERTGRDLSFEKIDNKKNPNSPSFDRIDNSKGYEVGNIQLVCWAYNDLKNSLSDEVLLCLARDIVSKADGSLV